MPYDDLVKRLREEAECPDNFPEDSNLMREAAEAIEKLSRLNAEITRRELKARMAKPRWIPVTERLPDAGKRVLCYCRANIYEVMKMRTDGDWVYDTNHVYMHSFVTHWMPLPQPPKEETK